MKLNDCFERFLADSVEPKDDDVKAAIAGHEEVRDFLESDEEYSSRHKETFLTGSYKRDTAIQPVKDVDLVVVTNADCESENPIDVLDELNRILKKKYKTKTHPQRRSIRIDRESMTLDVVPTAAPLGAKRRLKVPDREQKEWRWTHPKRHTSKKSELNDASRDDDNDRGRYVPTVKLVKKWKAVNSGDVRPKGFLLEVLVGIHHDPDARDWADCFIAFLESLVDEHGAFKDGDEVPSWEDPGLSDTDVDDKQLHTGLTSAEFARLVTLAKKSLANAKLARDAATVKESVKFWRAVFGPEFPEPDSEQSKSSKGGPVIAVTSTPKRDIRESPPFA